MEKIEPNIIGEVLNRINRIEQEEQVKVFYAIESGSRAWGFPSVDSDYDVRFFFVHPLEWYLALGERRDVIERPIVDDLDLSGWDFQKALRLFWKSNPPLLEWLQSPHVYLEKNQVVRRMREMAPGLFSSKACVYHYLHMAEGNFREYLQGDLVKSKKYFYVLRPVLACLWVEKYNIVPPMEFKVLVEDLIPDSPLRREVLRLLERKKAGEELGREPRIPSINDFLGEKIVHLKNFATKAPVRREMDLGDLDKLFIELLNTAWV